jgi:predicted nucleotide-binding protein
MRNEMKNNSIEQPTISSKQRQESHSCKNAKDEPNQNTISTSLNNSINSHKTNDIIINCYADGRVECITDSSNPNVIKDTFNMLNQIICEKPANQNSITLPEKTNIPISRYFVI